MGINIDKQIIGN